MEPNLDLNPEADTDALRVVDFSDDGDDPILPETTRDDTDAGWGESRRDNDDRLLAERPPHWE